MLQLCLEHPSLPSTGKSWQSPRRGELELYNNAEVVKNRRPSH